MINKFTVKNFAGESTIFELRSPQKIGIFVRDIQGLGPVDATVNVDEYAAQDGGRFNNARTGPREIIFSFNPLDNPTVEYSREKLYRIFPNKSWVEIEFETELKKVKINGVVKRNEPGIFSESVIQVVTVVCPFPHFKDYQPIVEKFTGLDPLWELPNMNDSLTEPLIEFSSFARDYFKNIIYPGTEPAGIEFFLNFIGTVKDITIFNEYTRQSMVIEDSKVIALLGSSLKKDDAIYINTSKDALEIDIIRDGNIINAISCLRRPIEWLQISSGNNPIAFTAAEGVDNIYFRIESYILHGGL